MIHFCTLFDSYYIDKGLVLYKSLESVSDDFVLYIFCFDDRCFEILNNMKLKHAVILHNSVLEDEELLKSGTFKGQFLENILTHKEVWEQIKNHKLKNENTFS